MRMRRRRGERGGARFNLARRLIRVNTMNKTALKIELTSPPTNL